MTKKSGAGDTTTESKRKTSPPPLRSGTRTAQKPPPLPPQVAAPRPSPASSVSTGPASSGTAPPSRRTPAADERAVQLDSIGRGLGELRALVASVAADIDALRTKEPGLSREGVLALGELATKLRQAAGAPSLPRPGVRAPAVPRGGPPPIPHTTAPRETMRSTMDISELAELVESLAPPPLLDVDIDDEGW